MAWSGKPDPVHALAALMGVKPATVRQWIARGNVVRTADGGFDPEALEAWIDRRDTRRIPASLRPVA